MDKQALNIFLAASIPVEGRPKKYLKTADVIAIREAVLALCNVVIPKYHLVWGGHPSITPMVNHVLLHHSPKKDNAHRRLYVKDRLTLYQSLHFEKDFPPDNNQFENVQFIKMRNQYGEQIEATMFQESDKEESKKAMRKQMINTRTFAAGVFIGGMDGVEEEFKIFRKKHPRAILLPIASTGGAAKILYDRNNWPKPPDHERLQRDYSYGKLFRDLLLDPLDNY